MTRALLIGWVAAAAAGCVATSTTLGTPRTAGAGRWQFVPSAGWGGQGTWTSNVTILPGTGTSTPTTSYSSQQAPFLEAAARRGITDDFDLGVRIFTFGAGVEAKYALHQTPWAESGLDVSLDPQAQLSTAGAAATLPVLVGWHFSSGHELVLSPRASWTAATVNGESTVWVGGGLGFMINLTDTFALMPEIVAQAPVLFAGSKGTPSPTFPWIQGGLAFLIGGAKGPRPPEPPNEDEAPRPAPAPAPAPLAPEPTPPPLPPNDPGV